MADQSNVVLPKELRLGAPATMPQSRSYMFKQQAALSNYSPKDTIQINLPRLQRSYLTKDSYLEFEVEFTYTPGDAGVGLSLDTPGALGLIDRIEVYDYLGSTQLESTSGFGQLVALLQDTCVDADEFATHWEITSGTTTPAITSDWERWGASAENSAKYQGGLYRMTQPTQGEIIDCGAFKDPSTNAAYVNNTSARKIRRKYHLPLFSFLGLLSPKYAPLHNGYTIMITLQTAENALSAAGVSVAITGSGPYTVTTTEKFGSGVSFMVLNARMCCQILELGPIAESMLLSTVGPNPMIVTTKAYRAYNTSIPQGASSFRLDLNINVASLTNVLWIMRSNTYLNSTKFNSLSHRQRNFLESWYFQYGSSVLPQTQGITAFKPSSNKAYDQDNGSECMIELLKARHMYNQPNHDHVFNKFNYAYDNASRFRQIVKNRTTGSVPTDFCYFTNSDSTTYFEKGKFACGLDLELVSGRTNEIICGMNTNGMNTSIFATFNATAAARPTAEVLPATGDGIWVEASRVDAWCEYDAFINVSPGIATTVSF